MFDPRERRLRYVPSISAAARETVRKYNSWVVALHMTRPIESAQAAVAFHEAMAVLQTVLNKKQIT